LKRQTLSASASTNEASAAGSGDGDSAKKMGELFNNSKSDVKSKSEAGGATAGSSLDVQLEQLLRLSPDELTGTRGGANSSKGPKELSDGPDAALRAAILNQYKGVYVFNV
jgi:hypothetical protein